MKELSQKYPIKQLCRVLKVTRSAYYHWLSGEKSEFEVKNEEIAQKVREIHDKHPEMGYRRIRDELERRHGIKVNDKRVLRIARFLNIKSCIKYRRKSCTVREKSPYHIVENVLNREFKAEAPNEKWLTDVTEFKYHKGEQIDKIYLSAIYDVYDKRIVAHVIKESNNNPLVFETFDKAVERNPEAKPMIHSDRGFQYTNGIFQEKVARQQMIQSMSRIGNCIDNGPMEGFWGILKREMYNNNRSFTNREELIKDIDNYIHYYNYERIQRGLKLRSPMEYHQAYAKKPSIKI